MADLQQLEEQIVGLSLLDAAALVKRLEEKSGRIGSGSSPGDGGRRRSCGRLRHRPRKRPSLPWF